MDADDEPEQEDSASYDYWMLKEIILDDTEALVDRDAAVEELKQLANEGNPYAQYLLGQLYRDGGLLIPDSKLAADWFYKAAYDHNLAAAQYQLGKLLLSNDVDISDPARGLEWLEIAAENGSDCAAYRLGKEYLKGEIVKKDVGKALKYLTEAANNDNQYAQYLLGKLCLTGREVKQDKKLAEYWLTRSSDQGNEHAQFFLDRIDSSRPPSVMLAATRLLYHMSNIFRDNSLPQTRPVGMRLDRKRLQKLREKKIAMGHKPDDHEEYTGPTMSM